MTQSTLYTNKEVTALVNLALALSAALSVAENVDIRAKLAEIETILRPVMEQVYANRSIIDTRKDFANEKIT